MKAKQLAPQTAEVHISMAEWLNRSHQELTDTRQEVIGGQLISKHPAANSHLGQ